MLMRERMYHRHCRYRCRLRIVNLLSRLHQKRSKYAEIT